MTDGYPSQEQTAPSCLFRPVLPLPENCRLPPKDLELLAAGRHPDVTSILGPQIVAGLIVVRCWVSGAEAVSISSQAIAGPPKTCSIDGTTEDADKDDGDHKVSLEQCQGLTDAAWLFEGAFENEGCQFSNVDQLRSTWHYELQIEYPGGGSASWHDPYSLGKLVPEEFLRTWAAGKACQCPAAMFGSHHLEVCPGLWGTRFSVWAPNAQTVSVVGDFNFWDGRAHPMCQRGPFGVWELFLPVWDLRGQKYGYEVRPRGSDGEDTSSFVKADPFALEFVNPVPDPSLHDAKVPTFDDYSRVAWNGTYSWADSAWLQYRADAFGSESWACKPLAIYEVHLATWAANEEGKPLSYRELAEPLAVYAEELGFNAVELLPVTQYPSEASWGYQCAAGLYAVDSRLGTPDDFRYLVDTLHRRSIAVFIDFVAAHFAKDPWGLAHYSGAPQFEYPGELGELPQWGTARYDFSKPEVRAYLSGAVEHWIDHFHVDGIRVDAVAAIVYKNFGREEDGDAILAGRGVKNEDGISFLRELCAWVRKSYPGVLMMAEESTNFKWVTSRLPEEGTERNNMKLEDLGFHLKWNMGYTYDALSFFRTELAKRSQLETFGWKKLAWYLAYAHNERWVLPFSHDNAQPQSLLDQMTAPSEMDMQKQYAQLQALLVYTIGMPGRPLLFMGTEVGEGAWSYQKAIDWKVVQAEPLKQQLKRWVAKLLRLYRELPALHCEDDNKESFVWLDKDSSNRCILAWQRCAKGSTDVIVIVNFSPTTVNGYEVPVNSKLNPKLVGEWHCVAYTDPTGATNGKKVAEVAEGDAKSEEKIAEVAQGDAETEEKIAEVAQGGTSFTTDLPGFGAQLWLAPQSKQVKLTFAVQHFDTAEGEDIRVVGSCPELGEWRSEAGVVLSTSPQLFPVWNGEVELQCSPGGVHQGGLGHVHFKFIVMKPNGDVVWEHHESNRSLSLRGNSCINVSATFGLL